MSRRRYQAERPLHLQLSFFATDADAAVELFEGVLVGFQPPPTSMMFAGLDRGFLEAARYKFGGGDLARSGR